MNYLTTTDHTRHLKDEAGTVLLISRLCPRLMFILSMARAMSLPMTVRRMLRMLWMMLTSCVVVTLTREIRERLIMSPRDGDTGTVTRGLGVS